MKYEFIAQPFGIMGPAVARVSFCIYLLKFVGTDKKKKYLFWAIIVTQWAVNLMTMIEVLVSCEHFASLWDPAIKGRCWSPKIQAYIGFFQGAWNSLTDLVLTFLPFLIIKNLNMKLSTRAALSIIMGMSIFAMVACIVKTIELQYIGQRHDFTYGTSKFVIWFTVEQYVVIIAASIPTIRPLLLKIAKLYGDSKNSRSSQNNSGASARASAPRQTARPSQSNSAMRLNSLGQSRKSESNSPEPKTPPPPGTIRKTISVYITSERRSQGQLLPPSRSITIPARPIVENVEVDIDKDKANRKHDYFGSAGENV